MSTGPIMCKLRGTPSGVRTVHVCLEDGELAECGQECKARDLDATEAVGLSLYRTGVCKRCLKSIRRRCTFWGPEGHIVETL